MPGLALLGKMMEYKAGLESATLCADQSSEALDQQTAQSLRLEERSRRPSLDRWWRCLSQRSSDARMAASHATLVHPCQNSSDASDSGSAAKMNLICSGKHQAPVIRCHTMSPAPNPDHSPAATRRKPGALRALHGSWQKLRTCHTL